MRISDDRMDMEQEACQRMAGKMHMHIRYGLPGKEIFELRLKGNLDIQMTDFGVVTYVTAAWLA